MRVIQDSDDDDDILENIVPPQQQAVASTEGHLPGGISTHPSGTGSTESLEKAVQKAHRTHLQSQPSQNEPESSVSLPEHPSKRRKTSVGFTPFHSSGIIVRERNSPITHGKLSEPGLLNENSWNLEGTMRATYAYHDPREMFPEPSSTVANATQTQRRVMEGVNMPTMLGLDSDTEAPRNLLPPEPSVPWSDMMKFTPADPIGYSGSPVQDAPPLEFTSNLPVQNLSSDSKRVLSQQTTESPSIRPLASPSNCKVGHETDSIDEQNEHSAAISSRRLSIKVSTVSPDSNHHNQRKELGDSVLRQKTPSNSLLDSDDDLAMDLPKEKYKPRPSRSRSSMIDNGEPIDYSVRPEKAKQASMRRKTTGAVGVAKRFTTPQKIQQICDMGFTPSTTKRALGRNDYDVTRTIDWLVTNGVGDDELATYDTADKSAAKHAHQAVVMNPEAIQVIMRDLNDYRRDDPVRGQDEPAAAVAKSAPDKPTSIDGISSLPINHTPRKTVDIKSHISQVATSDKTLQPIAIQISTPAATSGKKAKRRKTTLDHPEPETVPEFGHIQVAAVEKKKRGRGRPKKSVAAGAPIEAAEIRTTDDKPVPQQHEVLQELDLNLTSVGNPADTTETTLDIPLRKPENAHDKIPATDPVVKEAVPNMTSATPERLAKATGLPSVNKGKVPYRVGLSKRARIAPLLRVLKK